MDMTLGLWLSLGVRVHVLCGHTFKVRFEDMKRGLGLTFAVGSLSWGGFITSVLLQKVYNRNCLLQMEN